MKICGHPIVANLMKIISVNEGRALHSVRAGFVLPCRGTPGVARSA
jgi:hypothetical protein